MPLAAADSLAAIRARSRLGMAIAAMIRMIATTMSNSISEKPCCFRISSISSSVCGPAAGDQLIDRVARAPSASVVPQLTVPAMLLVAREKHRIFEVESVCQGPRLLHYLSQERSL